MAKETETKEVVKEAPVSEREARFKKYVENYMILSPKKGALKKARGEFDKVPDSFK